MKESELFEQFLTGLRLWAGRLSKGLSDDLAERVRLRWELEFVPEVVSRVRDAAPDKPDEVLWQIVDGLAAALVYADGLSRTRSSGSKRAIEIEERASAMLGDLEELLREHDQLSKEGSFVRDVPDVADIIEELTDSAPEWATATNFKQWLPEFRSTSQPPPSLADFIERASALWHIEHRLPPTRGDERTRVAHETLRLLNLVEKHLNHGALATILNIVEDADGRYSAETVKSLRARLRQVGKG